MKLNIKTIEKIYKEIEEKDKMLSEDFLNISFETMEKIERKFKKAGVKSSAIAGR